MPIFIKDSMQIQEANARRNKVLLTDVLIALRDPEITINRRYAFGKSPAKIVYVAILHVYYTGLYYNEDGAFNCTRRDFSSYEECDTDKSAMESLCRALSDYEGKLWTSRIPFCGAKFDLFRNDVTMNMAIEE